ncbi:carbohydrate ABC transporter permease [Dactylosporangium fulvum]|uniref:Carbohydrate ABC transporter permease n=1 Tax=Dactylosporangium fulvum TaxID=53359 RepID=A0ABY5W4S7_9ACTN|nr:carbohydrate ABC transporter permease [Dactylosporangium fulvum]UWP85057.1 carbohydrate ABC transporter permease [Dactylosporangium fulvum]
MTTISDPQTTAVPPKPEKAPRERGRFGVFNAFSHTVLVGWALLTTFPLLWAIMSGFKDDNEILTSAWSLPSKLRFENWSRAWNEANIGLYFLNTAIVVAGALVLTMLLGSMAAYVLARYDLKFGRFIYFLFVGGMMFPVFLALVPLFFVVKNMGLLSTHLGLILTYTAYALPFTVFFLTAFFRTLPTEVAEAGMVDGCSHFGLFFRIMLPMAKPGLISVGIFNLLTHWNQYILPIVLMQGQGAEKKWVLTQGLTALTINQGYAGDYSALFAGMAIAMLPVLILYLAFQRQVQSGLTAGHLK